MKSPFDFSTNWFQAYDVPLATNDNWITLRGIDRAGNTATTHFDVVLEYRQATNPAVKLTHKGKPDDGRADDPFQLSSDNLWATRFDACDSGSLDPLPTGGWAGGSFTWNIPWEWWVEGSHATNLVTNGWQQVFTIDANGKVTITKFNNLTVTRDTNSVVIPSL